MKTGSNLSWTGTDGWIFSTLRSAEKGVLRWENPAHPRKKQLSESPKNGLFLGSLFPERFLRGQNFGHFLATFFRTFSEGIFESPILSRKTLFWPKKLAIWPLLFWIWPAGNPCGTRLCGLFGHLASYFSHYYEKNDKKFNISGRKKWAFGQSLFFRKIFPEIFSSGEGGDPKRAFAESLKIQDFPLPFPDQMW